MSSTRHAETGSPFRQERYASSPELNQGLMANLVAKRCSVLTDPEDREMIWFLQYLSHERGLKRFAAELLELHPEQIATPAMREFGLTGKYSAEQVRAIRREIPHEHDFLADGERSAQLRRQAERANQLRAMSEGREFAAPQRESLPAPALPAEKFVALCHRASESLHDHLAELCLNPAASVDAGPWYFPTLIPALRAYMEEWALEHGARVVSTEVSRRIIETLEYSRLMRCLTLSIGIEGLGKSWSAEHYCRQRPGRARYVQVPATDLEIGFYIEIARAIGISVPSKVKAGDLSRRIEDTLLSGDLQIVFDECAWLWGVNGTRGGLPKRMLWVMTALVNKHVPVAFVATPQEWESNKQFVTEHTRWRTGQLTGRIELETPLPTALSEIELAEVVRANLPAADERAVMAITDYARNKVRCLGVLTAVVKRARYIAEKNQRTQPNRADISAAIQEKGFGAAPVATSTAPAAAPALLSRSNTPAAPLPMKRGVTPAEVTA